MGLATIDIDPLLRLSVKSAEIVGAYVAHAQLGRGVGRALANAIEELVVQLGFEKLLIISGSRNRETGYNFWYKWYRKPIRFDEDYFGSGSERVVWCKALRK
jgi:hypothetical protein